MSTISAKRGAGESPRRRFQWSFRTWVILVTAQVLLLGGSVVGLWCNAKLKSSQADDHQLATTESSAQLVASDDTIERKTSGLDVADDDLATLESDILNPYPLPPRLLDIYEYDPDFAPHRTYDGQLAGELHASVIGELQSANLAAAQEAAAIASGAVKPAGHVEQTPSGAKSAVPHVARKVPAPAITPSKPPRAVYYRASRRRVRAMEASDASMDRSGGRRANRRAWSQASPSNAFDSGASR